MEDRKRRRSQPTPAVRNLHEEFPLLRKTWRSAVVAEPKPGTLIYEALNTFGVTKDQRAEKITKKSVLRFARIVIQHYRRPGIALLALGLTKREIEDTVGGDSDLDPIHIASFLANRQFATLEQVGVWIRETAMESDVLGPILEDMFND